MELFSSLDLKTLMLISYTWRNYHSQHNKWWLGADREAEATSRRQKAEKGPGGKRGIWGMASEEVPGNNHNFGSMWLWVVANVPINTFFANRKAGKSLPPGPSQALPSGWILSAMWVFPTASHVFACSVAHPLLILGNCQCPRGDDTFYHGTFIMADAVETFSNSKEV